MRFHPEARPTGLTAMELTCITRAILAAIVISLWPAGPAGAQRGEAPASGLSCSAAAKPMARVELMFGASRKSGRGIADWEWRAFLADEVTPRFPDGLTVLAGQGQWRSADKRLVREAMRMVVILYAPGEDSNARIEAIRTAYKTRFGQDSVLRVDSGACVSF